MSISLHCLLDVTSPLSLRLTVCIRTVTTSLLLVVLWWSLTDDLSALYTDASLSSIIDGPLMSSILTLSSTRLSLWQLSWSIDLMSFLSFALSIERKYKMKSNNLSFIYSIRVCVCSLGSCDVWWAVFSFLFGVSPGWCTTVPPHLIFARNSVTANKILHS